MLEKWTVGLSGLSFYGVKDLNVRKIERFIVKLDFFRKMLSVKSQTTVDVRDCNLNARVEINTAGKGRLS